MENGAEDYRRFLNGDNDALTRLIKTYKDGLTFFLLAYTGDLNLAEEAMQETFVRLFVKRPKYKGTAQFRTWLYGIGRNTARELWRKAKNAPDTETPFDAAAAAETVYFEEERRRALYRAMEGLAPRYRQALWLFYFENMRAKEIAAILHKSVNGVEVLLHRARTALRAALEKEGFTGEDL